MTSTDKFYFYSKSADKLPGKGTNEYALNTEDYLELSNTKDWRKMLSNFYSSPFILDGEEWDSVENWHHAFKFRDEKKPGSNYNFYKTFTKNGGKKWSSGHPEISKQAGRAGKKRNMIVVGEKLPNNVKMRPDFEKIAKKQMTFGLLAKFSQNPDLKNVLLNTGDAQLWHVVSRKGSEYWDHLMRVRDCIRKYDNICDIGEISKFSSDIISNNIPL